MPSNNEWTSRLRIDLSAATAECHALNATYPGLVFGPLCGALDPQASVHYPGREPNIRLWMTICGQPQDLVRHGFMPTTWLALPPCGVKSHKKAGFGSAKVHRRKHDYKLESAEYDDVLDRLAPVFTRLYWSPSDKKHSV